MADASLSDSFPLTVIATSDSMGTAVVAASEIDAGMGHRVSMVLPVAPSMFRARPLKTTEGLMVPKVIPKTTE